jgi:hypothetical protein
LLFVLPLSAQASTRDANWREDLQYLWDNIQRHPDPFRSTSQADFEQMVSDLDAEIPNLTDEEIVVRLLQIVAALQDGHSWIAFQQSDYAFRYYPLHFYPFSDGVYVIEAAPEYADLVGARLVRIGETNAEQVVERLLLLAPHDNDSSRLVTLPMMLGIADILLGAGIIEDANQPGYVFERADGEQVTINPEPISLADFHTLIPVHWRLPEQEQPMSLSRVGEGFWWMYLEEEQAIYLQYNQTLSRSAVSGMTISSLVEELESALDTLAVNRLILDLRYNGGGDINTARPLRSFFSDNEFFHEPGNLIVLTGRNTFSAAVVFSLWLEQDVDPVFMGEPTGGKPLMFENARPITLPNSRLVGQISARARQDVDVSDTRQAIEPQLPIPPKSTDFFNGRDPVLEAALAYPDSP